MDRNGVKKRNWTFYAVLGVIGDIIIYPIIFVSLLSSFVMFNAKLNNKVPQIFGISLVKVVSGSMVASGFFIGDNVFVKKNAPETLQVGDVISFYYYRDNADDLSLSNLTLLKSETEDNSTSFIADEDFIIENRKTIKELPDSVNVYFHKIREIYVDEGGTIFFQTYGTTQNLNDSIKIREDYVVGKYVNTPRWVRDIFGFCNSSTGMIFLVILPLTILILFQCLSIIEQVNNLVLEKKVLERTEPWDSEDSFKANIGMEMDVSAKIYFYATAKKFEREAVWNFLWAHMINSKNEKEQKLYQDAVASVETVDKKMRNYWNFWFEHLSGRNTKKLMKYYERYYLERM